jgi:hypothetical protein
MPIRDVRLPPLPPPPSSGGSALLRTPRQTPRPTDAPSWKQVLSSLYTSDDYDLMRGLNLSWNLNPPAKPCPDPQPTETVQCRLLRDAIKFWSNLTRLKRPSRALSFRTKTQGFAGFHITPVNPAMGCIFSGRLRSLNLSRSQHGKC